MVTLNKVPGTQIFISKKPETVKKAMLGMLDWLSQGKSVKSYFYEEGEEFCSWQTVVTYMKDEEFLKENGLSFVPEMRVVAKAKGYKIWEQIIEDAAKGLNKEVNIASLKMKMRNKFGWDKSINDKATDEGEEEEQEKSKLDPRLNLISDQLDRAKKAVDALQSPSKDKEDSACQTELL